MGLAAIKRLRAATALLALAAVVAGCASLGGDELEPKDKQKSLKLHSKLALLYLERGDTQAASRHIEVAMDVDDESARAHHALALFHRYEGATEKAEAEFQLALDYDPSFAQAQNNYATFLFSQGKYERALKHLKKAVEQVDYAQRAQAFENMGRCYVKLDNAERAKWAFRKAVRLNDKLTRSYLELAELNFQEGRHAQARQYLRGFEELSDHTPQSLWLGIRLARALGDKDALASYELTLKKLYPGSRAYTKYKESL